MSWIAGASKFLDAFDETAAQASDAGGLQEGLRHLRGSDDDGGDVGIGNALSSFFLEPIGADSSAAEDGGAKLGQSVGNALSSFFLESTAGGGAGMGADTEDDVEHAAPLGADRLAIIDAWQAFSRSVADAQLQHGKISAALEEAKEGRRELGSKTKEFKATPAPDRVRAIGALVKAYQAAVDAGTSPATLQLQLRCPRFITAARCVARSAKTHAARGPGF